MQDFSTQDPSMLDPSMRALAQRGRPIRSALMRAFATLPFEIGTHSRLVLLPLAPLRQAPWTRGGLGRGVPMRALAPRVHAMPGVPMRALAPLGLAMLDLLAQVHVMRGLATHPRGHRPMSDPPMTAVTNHPFLFAPLSIVP
jgi:hypothetical protein